MITIEKSFYSNDKGKIYLVFSTSNSSTYPLSSVTKIYLTKHSATSSDTYVYNKTISMTGSYFLLSIDVANDITKSSESTASFNTHGIISVNAEYISNLAVGCLCDYTRFYDHKIMLTSINDDFSNIQKMSKRLNTYSFVEYILRDAVESSDIQMAAMYYDQLIKLATFGHSGIMQNNPNSAY